MLAVSYSKLLLEKCFRVQPGAQKALFVQEALTGCTSPINSVSLTRIIPSRNDLRSARPSKNDLSPAGNGRVRSSNHLTQSDRDRPVEK